jgi:hypothetical protein
VTRRVHLPRKHRLNPVIEPEHRWEGNQMLLYTTIYDQDEKLLKMWLRRGKDRPAPRTPRPAWKHKTISHTAPDRRRSIRRPCALMLLLIACLCVALAAPRAGAAGETLGVEDVWLYAPMDGSLVPTVSEPLLQVQYRQWTDEAVTDDLTPQPTFVEGLVGRAAFFGGPAGERHGDAMAYYLDISTFPTRAGAIALWYRPTRPLEQENSWLYALGWATFQASISGGNLLVYATGNNQHFAQGSLARFADGWQNRWHLIATIWDGQRFASYVDGQKVAERTDAEPMGSLSPILDLGSLPPGGGRPTPVLYAEAAFDELVILTKPLTDAQVEHLYQVGMAPGFGGFLSALGPGALVQVRREAYLRGEKATVNVTPFGDVDRALLLVTTDGKRLPIAEVSAREPSATILDTWLLRPGAYRLGVELRKGEKTVATSVGPRLVVRGRRQPEFPVGLGGSFSPGEQALELYERLPISHISSNGPADILFWKQLDRAFVHGICLFPNFNILEVWGNDYRGLQKPPYFVPGEGGKMRVNPELGWTFLQTLVWADGSPDDHRMTSSASPFSPVSYDMMTARIKQIMAAAGDHPGLWAVSFQDEVPFRMNQDERTGKWKVGDYSEAAIEHFKRVTGLPPAFPPTDPEGTVWPEDHPYLRWMREIGLPGNDFTNPGFEDLYYRLGQEVKKYRPDVITTNYSGGEYGKNDVVLDWNYPTIWGPEPWESGPGSGYLDYVFDRHWARQDARPRKPLWALLGWWSGDMTRQPEWCVADFRLQTELALAKGCKQLMWFDVGNGPAAGPESGPFSRPDLRAELERWCAFLHEKGGVFAQLEKRPYRKVAVLWSETNRAGFVARTPDKAEHYLVFAGLRSIGASPDVITDRMIREGCLNDYEGLVLCGFSYSSTDLWKAIQDFATRGGKVFVDTTSKLVPPGAISLGVRWDETFADPQSAKHANLQRSEAVAKWAERLRPIVLPALSRPDLEVLGSDGTIGPHLLWAGETPYLFVINTDLEQPRSAVIRFKHAGPVAYDLMTGEQAALTLEDGRVEVPVTLQPGAWAAYVLPPGTIEGVRLEASAAGGAIDARVSVIGADGQRLPAALPLHVELLDPAGQGTPYDGFSSTDRTGAWAGAFRLGSLTEEAGTWRVRVTELLTGNSVERGVPVKW